MKNIYENLNIENLDGEIWKDLDEGMLTQKEIAKKFGVKHQTISLIKNKKIWFHVQLNNEEIINGK